MIYRVRSIGKSGFRFSKSKSGFPNRTRNPKMDFTCEKSVLRVDFNPDFLDFLFTVRLGNPKKDLQTVLANSGLLFANYACACKTAVLKNSFSNPFADFPIER